MEAPAVISDILILCVLCQPYKKEFRKYLHLVTAVINWLCELSLLHLTSGGFEFDVYKSWTTLHLSYLVHCFWWLS